MERLNTVRSGLMALDAGELETVRRWDASVPVRTVIIVQHLLEHGHARRSGHHHA